jgi:EEF1A lysine methyltransferase 4
MATASRAGLSEEMYDDGYLNITNIDISKTVIASMAARTAEKKGLTWQIMSCTALDFGDASFDAVIDKGTLDSILCGENSACWLCCSLCA